ncbi:MAG: hypothetical protein ACJ75J_14220 [Cytophagaceae bacterium]
MIEVEIQAFRKLKNKVEQQFRLRYPECTKSMESWTGQEIVNFQEELSLKVNGRISEKWFYTHIKNETPGKIPRIDILNLLSKYAGYAGWTDFMHQEKEPTEKEESVLPEANPVKERKNRIPVYAMISVLLLAATAYIIIKPAADKTQKEYRFCFTDAYKGTAITESPVEVTVLKENESPIVRKSDATGCLLLNEEEKIKLLIRCRYYKTDTLVRIYKEHMETEEIKLKPDDYALMIHIFSQSGMADWKKRKEQLNGMIADEAKIYQVYQQQDGMELYNKEEFIDKLTMPLKSLGKIEILETEYKNDQIVLMRFKQDDSHEK